MTSTRWPLVVNYLLNLLPTLPGLDSTSVFDADPVTAASFSAYAIVGRTTDDSAAGSYARLTLPSGLVSESGSVRVQIVSQSGTVDPSGIRSSAFAIADALEAVVDTDQSLGGLLGALGVTTLTVDVQSIANANGAAQSLVVSVNYSSQI